MEKYINADGLVGIVVGLIGERRTSRLFDVELIKMILARDPNSYIKRELESAPHIRHDLIEHIAMRQFLDLHVKFVKRGTKFFFCIDDDRHWQDRLHFITEGDLFTA